MKVITSYLLCLFLLFGIGLYPTGPAAAQEAVSLSGVEFDVDNVEFGVWRRPRYREADNWIKNVNEDPETLNYIALTYHMMNKNEQKKFDLDAGSVFQLRDDLGNHYRQMKKPDEYTQEIMFVSKNYPSLYPGETFGETLFFEAPIATAQEVILRVDTGNIGGAVPVELKVPLTSRQGAQSVVRPSPFTDKGASADTTVQPSAKSNESGFSIKILSPQNNVVFDRGELVHVHVQAAPEKALLSAVIINALDHTYEDHDPAPQGIYDLNIPIDFPIGPSSVNVIAQWTLPSGEKVTASDDILIMVGEPSFVARF